MSDKLREALDDVMFGVTASLIDRHVEVPDSLAAIVAAARAYLDEQEPDYEAAQSFLDDIILNLLPEGQGLIIDADFIVDAALAGRRLVVEIEEERK